MPNRLRNLRRGVAQRLRRSVLLDADDDASTWLILFGGRNNKVGMPPFEFFRVAAEVPTKRLFVRDLDDAWYHRGAGEAGATIEEVAGSLSAVLAERDSGRVVTAGLSAGGYAALLFGALLGVDTALAFAPQTVVDPHVLTEMGDKRWTEPLFELERKGALDENWLDLQTALPRAMTAPMSSEIYYDPGFRLDSMHAERIADVDGVHLHVREGAGHNVPKAMRESGELGQVLHRALGAEPPPG